MPVRVGATYRSATLIVDALVANLSQGGLFLESQRIDPIGTMAEVALDVPGHSLPLIVSGRVAWSQARGMGILFDELERTHRVALANLLLRHNT